MISDSEIRNLIGKTSEDHVLIATKETIYLRRVVLTGVDAAVVVALLVVAIDVGIAVVVVVIIVKVSVDVIIVMEIELIPVVVSAMINQWKF